MRNNLKILDLTVLSPDCGGGWTEEGGEAANVTAVSRFFQFIAAAIKFCHFINHTLHIWARIDINENG